MKFHFHISNPKQSTRYQSIFYMSYSLSIYLCNPLSFTLIIRFLTNPMTTIHPREKNIVFLGFLIWVTEFQFCSLKSLTWSLIRMAKSPRRGMNYITSIWCPPNCFSSFEKKLRVFVLVSIWRYLYLLLLVVEINWCLIVDTDAIVSMHVYWWWSVEHLSINLLNLDKF